jgi:hypothetical protein
LVGRVLAARYQIGQATRRHGEAAIVAAVIELRQLDVPGAL